MGYAFGCLTFRYATFSGRARRMEYWMFCLVVILLSLFLGLFLGFGQGAGAFGPSMSRADVDTVFLVYQLFLFLPSIAVTVRRLHDTNRSGWWWLLSFLPGIGTIWLFVLMVLPGTRGSNDYGDDPIHTAVSRQDVLNALGRAR